MHSALDDTLEFIKMFSVSTKCGFGLKIKHGYCNLKSDQSNKVYQHFIES